MPLLPIKVEQSWGDIASTRLRRKSQKPQFLTYSQQGPDTVPTSKRVKKKLPRKEPAVKRTRLAPPEKPRPARRQEQQRKSRVERKRKERRRQQQAASKRRGPNCVAKEGGEAFWEIEKIIDKRVRKGLVEYRIRWKNCSPSMDTWEPSQNLCNSAYRDALQFNKERNLMLEQRKRDERRLGLEEDSKPAVLPRDDNQHPYLHPNDREQAARKKRKIHYEEEWLGDHGEPWKWTDEEQVRFRDVERINVNDANVQERVTEARVYGIPVVLVGMVGWANFAKRWLTPLEGSQYQDDDDRLDLDLSRPHQVDIGRMQNDIGEENVPVVKRDYDEENPIDGNISASTFLKSCWPRAAGAARATTPAADRLYLHQWQFPLSETVGAKLCHQNLPLPNNIFGEDLLKYWRDDLPQCQRDSPFQYIFMGRSDTTSKLHCDPGGLAISIAPIVGEKECVLVHRADGALCLYHLNADLERIDLQSYPLMGNARMWKTKIQPGEILIMPHGTYHQCRNVTPCLSYSRFHLDKVNLVAFLQSMLDGDAPEHDHAEVLWNATSELMKTVEAYIDWIQETRESSMPLPPLDDDMVQTIDTLRSLRTVCCEIARRERQNKTVKAESQKHHNSKRGEWDTMVDDVDLCLHDFRYRLARKPPVFVPRRVDESMNVQVGLRTRQGMSSSTVGEDFALSTSVIETEGGRNEHVVPLVAYRSDLERSFLALPVLSENETPIGRDVDICAGDKVRVRLHGKGIKGEVLVVERDMDAAYLSYEDYPELYSEYEPFQNLRRPISGERSSEMRFEDLRPGLVVLNRCGPRSEEYRAIVKSIARETFVQVQLVIGERQIERWLKRDSIMDVFGSARETTSQRGITELDTSSAMLSDASDNDASTMRRDLSPRATHATVSSDASSSASFVATFSVAPHDWRRPLAILDSTSESSSNDEVVFAFEKAPKTPSAADSGLILIPDGVDLTHTDEEEKGSHASDELQVTTM